MTRLYDGIHVYEYRSGGLLEHRVDDGNDIELEMLGGTPIETLLGWPTPAMRQARDEHGYVLWVGCKADGRVIETNV